MTITFTTGNLLEAKTDALVNTVNTVGVMGKGVALMFKDTFPENFKAYVAACKAHEVVVGRMFVVARQDLVDGPKWVINFPTKQHWRNPSKMEWIIAGLDDLKRVIADNGIRSIAIPPLGAGNGGLPWESVRSLIVDALSDTEVDALIYEPTSTYQNVAKRSGVEKLTAPRALVAELVRRYWVLGMECSLLEIQKLAWFLERSVSAARIDNTFNFRFKADRFGPYSQGLRHLLDELDGSYLHCDKRISDATPLDVISYDYGKADRVTAYLSSTEAKVFLPALEKTSKLIEGYESPYGMELLATVDWLRTQGAASVDEVRKKLAVWPAGQSAARRKVSLFNERMVGLALDRLVEHLPA